MKTMFGSLIIAVVATICLSSCIGKSTYTNIISYSVKADTAYVSGSDTLWTLCLPSVASKDSMGVIYGREAFVRIAADKGTTELPTGSFQFKERTVPLTPNTVVSGYLVKVQTEKGEEYQPFGSFVVETNIREKYAILCNSGSITLAQPVGASPDYYDVKLTAVSGEITYNVTYSGVVGKAVNP